MNAQSVLILLLVALLAGYAIRVYRRNGSCSCSKGGCDGNCGHCNACPANKK